MKSISSQSIVELLKAQERDVWYPDQAASEAVIEAAEKVTQQRFPEDYRGVLRAFGGGSLYGPASRIVFIRPDQLGQFNPIERAPDLAEMFIFADDEGDYFYSFDPKNLRRHGSWAVHAVEIGLMERKDSFSVAAALRPLLERILEGGNVIEDAWHRSRGASA